MTKDEARHLAEVLNAFADGKQPQKRINGGHMIVGRWEPADKVREVLDE